MTDIDKMFEGMTNAPIFGRGTYMGPGTFRVAIKKAFYKRSYKGLDLFICEFEILETNNEMHPVGSSGSWTPKIALPNTFGDIKSLIFSALGQDGRTVKDNDSHIFVTRLARALCGSETAKQELAETLAGLEVESAEALVLGKEVGLVTEQVKTKEQRDFTRYTWSPA